MTKKQLKIIIADVWNKHIKKYPDSRRALEFRMDLEKRLKL